MVHHRGAKGTFYEVGVMKIMGKKFSSGGAMLGINRKTGKYGGILYAYPKENAVGTWDGKMKVPAQFGREWSGNMGDVRQTVRFTHMGRNFTGTYFKSGSDIVRVKETK